MSVPSRKEQLGSGGTHALDRAPDDEGELAGVETALARANKHLAELCQIPEILRGVHG